MTDATVPEADAAEQRQPIDDSAEPRTEQIEVGIEVPEADALEQSQPVPAGEGDDHR